MGWCAIWQTSQSCEYAAQSVHAIWQEKICQSGFILHGDVCVDQHLLLHTGPEKHIEQLQNLVVGEGHHGSEVEIVTL